MKRVITAVILLFSLVFMSIFSYNYISKSTKLLSNDIKDIYICINNENYEKAKIQMKNLSKNWKKKAGYLTSVCRHNEIDDISRLFHRIKQAIINKEKNNALTQLKELEFMISHLLEMEKTTMSNIL